VPPGAQALLLLPAATAWLESGKSPSGAAGVLDIKQTAAGPRLRLGSGTYRFSATALKDSAAKAQY
jgi:hypothetical protein